MAGIPHNERTTTSSQPCSGVDPELWTLLVDFVDKRAAVLTNDATQAEEFSVYAIESLAKENWSILKKFDTQRGEFKAFLTVTIKHLHIDFLRKQWGRVDVPTHIKVRGSEAERLFALLCKEGYTPDVAEEQVLREVPDGRSLERVRAHIRLILTTVHDCGKKNVVTSLTADADAPGGVLELPDPDTPSPEEAAQARETQAVLESLRQWCAFEGMPLPAFDAALADRVQTALNNHLTLETEERLLLQMVYQDGLSVSAAGQILGIQFPHKQLEKILTRIRTVLLDEMGGI